MTAARAAVVVTFALALTGAGCVRKPARTEPVSPVNVIQGAPGGPPAPARPLPVAPADQSGLLAPLRLASLPEGERDAWTAYLARSAAWRTKDRAVIDAELAQLGRKEMTQAPNAPQSFQLTKEMTPLWFTTPQAKQIADAIVSYQTASGGWSKHVDYTKGPRQPGQSYFGENNRWSWIATFDNNSTTAQMRFLFAADAAAPRTDRYRNAYLRGLDFILEAQFPNGCWPQVYPLQGSYHDAATFNDDAMVNVLGVLSSVAAGEVPFVAEETEQQAREAVARGTDCILASQVLVNDTLTIWGQQHDPLTLVPVKARAYEPASLASKESASILDFLVSIREPNERVVAAAHAAADWFLANRIYGFSYDYDSGLVARDSAGPIWARLSEIGTNRPIFSNRDGVILYSWDQLTDRRRGYGWYSIDPISTLRRYDKWARNHPKP